MRSPERSTHSATRRTRRTPRAWPQSNARATERCCSVSGIAGAAAGNVMLMALALYSGKYAGMAAEYAALFRWGSLAIATPAVFWAGKRVLPRRARGAAHAHAAHGPAGEPRAARRLPRQRA